ncbi:MAG: hypothetical protein LQ340_000770 [Diploschistes diacapsis]|nr:MAG: hypothetical protein LQ340_000770 [Diploschistes diacapsis]
MPRSPSEDPPPPPPPRPVRAAAPNHGREHSATADGLRLRNMRSLSPRARVPRGRIRDLELDVLEYHDRARRLNQGLVQASRGGSGSRPPPHVERAITDSFALLGRAERMAADLGRITRFATMSDAALARRIQDAREAADQLLVAPTDSLLDAYVEVTGEEFENVLQGFDDDDDGGSAAGIPNLPFDRLHTPSARRPAADPSNEDAGPMAGTMEARTEDNNNNTGASGTADADANADADAGSGRPPTDSADDYRRTAAMFGEGFPDFGPRFYDGARRGWRGERFGLELVVGACVQRLTRASAADLFDYLVHRGFWPPDRLGADWEGVRWRAAWERAHAADSEFVARGRAIARTHVGFLLSRDYLHYWR